jgi:hypothetical protein
MVGIAAVPSLLLTVLTDVTQKCENLLGCFFANRKTMM